jgi:hypothetical protein
MIIQGFELSVLVEYHLFDEIGAIITMRVRIHSLLHGVVFTGV